MKTITISSWCFLLCFFCTTTHLCFAADTLSSGQSLYHNQTLVSAQGNFELGYYQPGTASKYYIAIWYKKISVQTKTSVWMANRDDPLTDPASAELKLLESGNLVIFNQSKNQVWSTNLTFKGTNLSELVLGDDGNLVLRDGSNPSVVFWQSFDYPTDTWLPGGKLRYDNKTKLPTLLTSWKNSEDPAQGMYSVQLDPIGKQYNMFWNRSEQYWSSGPWDGQIFSLVPEMTLNYIFDFSYISNENESYFTYDIYKYNKSIFSRCVLSLSGQVTQLTWLDNSQSWNMFWAQPRMKCALNGFCGANSLCNESDLCQCLPGFEPHSSIDWNAGKTSGGCVRKTPLQCNDKEGFWQMANIRYPENDTKASGVENDQDCKIACLNNCSCIAYCSSYRRGCLTWDLDRLNFQQLLVRNSSGGDLYLKLAASELQSLGGDHKDNARVIILTTVITGVVVVVGALMYISWRRNANLKGKKKKKDMKNLLFRESKDIRESSDPGEFKDNPELPIFNFEKLAVATNEFDAENKIGQGGFGPVYKGILLDGQEIAVKRLSKSSGQGLEEFKNEVVVISKLQHRNLVRILGYCVQGDEKMLIYEYMPNKSLDSFIFDSTKKTILDWRMRFEIVIGICQGLTYLHRDSRLRVIHRDLKASNILLDHDLKPKISDFGMARIFGGDEHQANTLRVVGTYGYMSPEYAMKGVFSEKSDVYSFGVLLLELVSGKKNTSFYHHKQFWSLVGYAWNLWSEGKTEELIDPVISVSSDKEQILRCVHVGLLCVQDFAKDRPTIPSIILLLTSETPSLAIPEQPVYTGREVAPDSDSLEENCKMFSRNNVSFTTLDGR